MSRVDAALLGEDMSSQLARLDRGEHDCRDLLELHLSAISASQPMLNAYLSVDADASRRAADDSDARRKAGTARALEGVPVAIKDNIDAMGFATTAGMATRRDAAVATVDSPVVARLRSAGAVISASSTCTKRPWAPTTTTRILVPATTRTAPAHAWRLQRWQRCSGRGRVVQRRAGHRQHGFGSDPRQLLRCGRTEAELGCDQHPWHGCAQSST